MPQALRERIFLSEDLRACHPQRTRSAVSRTIAVANCQQLPRAHRPCQNVNRASAPIHGPPELLLDCLCLVSADHPPVTRRGSDAGAPEPYDLLCLLCADVSRAHPEPSAPLRLAAVAVELEKTPLMGNQSPSSCKRDVASLSKVADAPWRTIRPTRTASRISPSSTPASRAAWT